MSFYSIAGLLIKQGTNSFEAFRVCKACRAPDSDLPEVCSYIMKRGAQCNFSALKRFTTAGLKPCKKQTMSQPLSWLFYI
jgi:hypothetical protein